MRKLGPCTPCYRDKKKKVYRRTSISARNKRKHSQRAPILFLTHRPTIPLNQESTSRRPIMASTLAIGAGVAVAAFLVPSSGSRPPRLADS